MDELTQTELKLSLIKALDQWWENLPQPAASKIDFLVGDDITVSMATASMSVLAAVASVQDYMRDNDLLKED